MSGMLQQLMWGLKRDEGHFIEQTVGRLESKSVSKLWLEKTRGLPARYVIANDRDGTLLVST